MEADFRDPAVIADPYPLLARLRADDPVHWNPGLRAWVLTRHADVDRAFKDPRLSSDRIRPFVSGQSRADSADVALLGDCLSLWMVFNDPPAHTRLRAPVAQAFTRRAVEALRPAIAARVEALLAGPKARGRLEVVGAFAWPLPALVIAGMLGVPEGDVEDLKRWSDDLAAFVLAARLDPGRYARAAASLAAMTAYFDGLIAARRTAPGGQIIDSLIAAEADGLSRAELVASCVLILFAGHETTAHFLANGLRALILHPGAALAGEGLRRTIDEVLRWDGPSIAQVRVAAEDLALHGRRIAAGDRVYLMINAANRDPAVFRNPDAFDPGRADGARQLAFGSGLHVCLGAHLARLEGEVAFPRLLAALPRARLTGEPPDWSDSLVIRGMHRMEVAFG
jgi:cytochrome P450